MDDAELRDWMESVRRRGERRLALDRLALAGPLGRSVSLARRLRWKVQEVGIRETSQLVVGRVSARLREARR